MKREPHLTGWQIIGEAMDWDMEALRGFSDEAIANRVTQKLEESGVPLERYGRRRIRRDIAAWRRTNP